jgi:stage III sporulation protein SpoIIIAA
MSKTMKLILEEDKQSRFTISGQDGNVKCSVGSKPKHVWMNTIAKCSVSSKSKSDEAHTIGKTFRIAGKTKCFYVDKSSGLEIVVDRIRKFLADEASKEEKHPRPPMFVSIGCQGAPKGLEVLQIATSQEIYLVDCQRIGGERACALLGPLLANESYIKLVHDLHEDALMLHKFGNTKVLGLLDTQLLAELVWKKSSFGFNEFLSKLDLPKHPSWEFFEGRKKSGIDPWSQRPIAPVSLEHAALEVACLQNAAKQIFSLLGLNQQKLDKLLVASTSRANHSIKRSGSRAVCFDKKQSFALASTELMREFRPDDGFYGEPLVIESDVDEIISILPRIYTNKFMPSATNVEEDLLPVGLLSDIALDIGRRAHCWMCESRVYLCDDATKVVEKEEIETIVSHLGTFGSDNRAGLDGTHRRTGSLHRFSVMKDRDEKSYGITIRVGRNVKGNASMLMDLLKNYRNKSILILGEPGSGKTTIVREAIRMLAEEQSVVVVDTSNEIAGDGTIPHSCIGKARRMMIPSLDKQGAKMIECVQNHCPHVIVVDEIGRSREAQAASTVKQRGIRMVASAHGDLRSLLKNSDLNGLVGGLETVTIGDEMAKEEAKKRQQIALEVRGDNSPIAISKNMTMRRSAPTFEIIVEVSRDSRDEWRIVHDSASAVDKILEGCSYPAQLRKRDPETGAMWMDWVDA